MIEQQIRPWQVLQPGVDAQLFSVKRELFVPERYRNLAFAETQIPLGYGECMLSPGVEARIFNALNLTPDDQVFEVGTGSGYMAALLAATAHEVISMEILPQLADFARANLGKARIAGVEVRGGDGLDPVALQSDYDVIVLSGSLPLLPLHLTTRLKAGGRLIAIIGDEVNMEVQLTVRKSESSFVTTSLFETVAPGLKNGPPVSAFSL